METELASLRAPGPADAPSAWMLLHFLHFRETKHFADDPFFKVTRHEEIPSYHTHTHAHTDLPCSPHTAVSGDTRLVSPRWTDYLLCPSCGPFRSLSSPPSLAPSLLSYLHSGTDTNDGLSSRNASALGSLCGEDGLSAPDRQLNKRGSSPRL